MVPTGIIYVFHSNLNFQQVWIKLKKPGSKLEHQGVKIEFIGQIGQFTLQPCSLLSLLIVLCGISVVIFRVKTQRFDKGMPAFLHQVTLISFVNSGVTSSLQQSEVCLPVCGSLCCGVMIMRFGCVRKLTLSIAIRVTVGKILQQKGFTQECLALALMKVFIFFHAFICILEVTSVTVWFVLFFFYLSKHQTIFMYKNC